VSAPSLIERWAIELATGEDRLVSTPWIDLEEPVRDMYRRRAERLWQATLLHHNTAVIGPLVLIVP